VEILMLADGRAVHTVRYQEQLRRFGVKVTLASLERGATVDIQLKKKSVSSSLSYAYANREIKELVRKLDPDIVNPHFASAYGFSVALSKVWKRKPVVMHCLGSDILVSPRKSIAHRRKVMYALSKASLIFADSTYVKDRVQALHSDSNCQIIPWGVESEILEIFKNRKVIDFTSKRPLFIFCPRPHNKIYNNLFILESLRELIKEEQIKLTFASGGDDFIKFKEIIRSEFSDNEIAFYDFKPRDEYIQFISNFDIYLSASLSDSSPASLIEAMAAGMFPVVADIPGLSDWIDQNNAVLFNPGSKQDLRNKLAKLLNEPPDIGSILEANHKKVIEKGMFENNIRETVREMEKLL
jgi:glycosyltransferase involved in cell wall biosynthesis